MAKSPHTGGAMRAFYPVFRRCELAARWRYRTSDSMPRQHLTCFPVRAEAPVSADRRRHRSPLGRPVSRPEVIREPWIGQIRIGHEEVSFEAPRGAPAIAHDKPALAIIVAHHKDRMPAE